jgi:hypothetical protein
MEALESRLEANRVGPIGRHAGQGDGSTVEGLQSAAEHRPVDRSS